MWRLLLPLALLFAGAPAGPADAQSDPRLTSAVRLAQEGLSDSARAVVSGLLERTSATDTLYPQILYTRALIAAEPGAMRTDLQRVAVEYAASNWADDALLRLALVEYAGNQLEAAARNLQQFELDHSTSALYPRAAVWAGRVYFELRRPDDACRWLRAGRERAGADVELRTQLEAAARRCSEPAAAPDSAPVAAAPIAAPPDSARRVDTVPARTAPAPTAPAPTAPAFRIQIAAVTTAAAADSIAARARATGIEAVVTREPPHYKVRVGAYATRAEAAAALPQVRARFRGAPFVVATRE